MKRGWTRYWLCASAILLCISPSAVPQKSKRGRGANELTLAGFRPGKDSLAAARARMGKALPMVEDTPDMVVEWHDFCVGRELKIEADSKGVIQTVTVMAEPPVHRCSPEAQAASSHAGDWKTGEGVRLGDKAERVVEIYGPPNSSGPSVKAGSELELMFYMFDWAGSDVPQVMEISCNKTTGRVVEIMLAFQSL